MPRSPSAIQLGIIAARLRPLDLAALLIGLAPSAAQAIEQPQLAACLSTADLVQRLACYDGLDRAPAPAPMPTAASSPAPTALPSSSGAGDYPIVELIDLKVDRDRLVGRGVTTAGRLNVSGQIGFLRNQGIDNTPLHVSISRLPTEAQKEVRARCSSACSATIRGKVVHVPLGLGLTAEEVTIQTTTP